MIITALSLVSAIIFTELPSSLPGLASLKVGALGPSLSAFFFSEAPIEARPVPFSLETVAFIGTTVLLEPTVAPFTIFCRMEATPGITMVLFIEETWVSSALACFNLKTRITLLVSRFLLNEIARESILVTRSAGP